MNKNYTLRLLLLQAVTTQYRPLNLAIVNEFGAAVLLLKVVGAWNGPKWFSQPNNWLKQPPNTSNQLRCIAKTSILGCNCRTLGMKMGKIGMGWFTI